MPSTSSVCGESQQSDRSQEVEVMPAIQTKPNSSDHAGRTTTWLCASLAPLGELFLCCVHCTTCTQDPSWKHVTQRRSPRGTHLPWATLSTHIEAPWSGCQGREVSRGKLKVVQGCFKSHPSNAHADPSRRLFWARLTEALALVFTRSNASFS